MRIEIRPTVVRTMLGKSPCYNLSRGLGVLENGSLDETSDAMLNDWIATEVDLALSRVDTSLRQNYG